MTVEEAVKDRLESDVAVAAVVSDRVYQLLLPENGTYPAIRVQLIDEPGSSHLRGPNGLTRARVQADAYVEATGDDPYAEATELNTRIQAALVDDGPFTAGSPVARQVTGVLPAGPRQVRYEAEERRLVRVMQDFIVWSRPVH